jgi:hypothetical protein
MFSLRFSSVTSTDATAPAGITAPLEPTTGVATVALKRSPTLLVLVQIFDPDVRASVAPAGIVPTLADDPAGVRVTVLPLEVVRVAGVRVVVVGVVLVVVRGAEVLGVVAADPAGTSVSAGRAAVSLFASWMSLLRAESAAAVSSFFAQAPARSASESTSDAFSRGIY